MQITAKIPGAGEAATLARSVAAAQHAGQPYGKLRTQLVETIEAQLIADYLSVVLPDRDLTLRVMACSRADRLVEAAMKEVAEPYARTA